MSSQAMDVRLRTNDETVALDLLGSRYEPDCHAFIGIFVFKSNGRGHWASDIVSPAVIVWIRTRAPLARAAQVLPVSLERPPITSEATHARFPDSHSRAADQPE